MGQGGYRRHRCPRPACGKDTLSLYSSTNRVVGHACSYCQFVEVDWATIEAIRDQQRRWRINRAAKKRTAPLTAQAPAPGPLEQESEPA